MINPLLLFFLIPLTLYSFEKLDTKYQVTYGSSEAKVKMTEYFSFVCPKCIKFIKEDFPSFKKKYIDTGHVQWSFHPDPADLITLRAMICLEKLSEEQKQPFLALSIAHISEGDPLQTALLMKQLLQSCDHSLPELDQMEFLEKSAAFEAAYSYLKQKDTVAAVPTIEIDGIVYQEFPSVKFLEKQLNSRLSRSASCKQIH